MRFQLDQDGETGEEEGGTATRKKGRELERAVRRTRPLRARQAEGRNKTKGDKRKGGYDRGGDVRKERDRGEGRDGRDGTRAKVGPPLRTSPA